MELLRIYYDYVKYVLNQVLAGSPESAYLVLEMTTNFLDLAVFILFITEITSGVILPATLEAPERPSGFPSYSDLTFRGKVFFWMAVALVVFHSLEFILKWYILN